MKIKTKNRLIAAFAFTAIVGASVGVATLANSANAALDGGFGLHGNYSLTAFAAETTAKKITVAGTPVDVTETMELNSTDDKDYKLCVTAIDVADLEGLTGTTVGYDYNGVKYNGTGSGLTNAVYSSLTIRTGDTTIRKVTPKEMKGVTDEFAQPMFVVAEFQPGTTTDGVKAKLEVNAPIATATKYHSADYHGMGECDFETLIAVDTDTVKINTAKANGKVVDGWWCWGSQVPEAVLNISDAVKNAASVTLEFNLKAANCNESPNNAFGIAMAEGYKGLNMSIWSKNEQLAYYALTSNVLGGDAFHAENNTNDAWLKTAIYSATGANIRAVREGANIYFYAQNGTEWVKIFETTCAANAKTDIKFLGMGSDYTVSNISVGVNYKVTTSFTNDAAYNYAVKVERPENGKAILTVYSDPDTLGWLSWSRFPTKITVNGVETAITTADLVSDGANKLHYTKELTITGDTSIEVTVEKGAQVAYNASVNNAEMGEVKCDMEINENSTEYYWNDLCTLTITANEGYELENIVIGGETLTEGWTQDGRTYTYKHLVTGDIDVTVNLKPTPEIVLENAVVNITGADDLGETVNAKLHGDTDYTVTLTKNADGAYTFGGTFLRGEYKLSLADRHVGYTSPTVSITKPTIDPITLAIDSLTTTVDKGPRADASITVTNDKITIVGTQHDAFAEWGSNHNDNAVPYVTLNLSDEAKNAKNVTLEFNLKTSNQCGYFINGFGVGMTGFNGLRMLFADTADKAYTPDGKIVTAILNGRKTGEDNISGGPYCVETYGWIETLALTDNGVNMRAVREGTTLKFYAQNAEGEWVLIQFLAPTNGDYGNLQYVDHVTVAESDLNDFRFIANGANWDVSAINVTVNETSSEAQ